MGDLGHDRTGQVNLMTAGAGIQHSELSTDRSTALHGVQLWTALPDRSRHVAPSLLGAIILAAGAGYALDGVARLFLPESSPLLVVLTVLVAVPSMPQA